MQEQKILELIYTSAPRGLLPGRSGYTTVAMTYGMAPNLITPLENLSGYTFTDRDGQFPPAYNPVACSYRKVHFGNLTLRVASRVAPCGLDYSGRNNKIAHHIYFESAEELDRVAGGPVNLFRERLEGAKDNFLHEYTGKPEKRRPPNIVRVDPPTLPAQNSAALTGDAGWAGAIAERLVENPDKPFFIAFPAGTELEKLLGFVAETARLLPPEQLDRFTFSTYFDRERPGEECFLRMIPEFSPLLPVLRNFHRDDLLDLTESPVRPVPDRWAGSALVERAKNGDPKPPPPEPVEPPKQQEQQTAQTETEQNTESSATATPTEKAPIRIKTDDRPASGPRNPQSNGGAKITRNDSDDVEPKKKKGEAWWWSAAIVIFILILGTVVVPQVLKMVQSTAETVIAQRRNDPALETPPSAPETKEEMRNPRNEPAATTKRPEPQTAQNAGSGNSTNGPSVPLKGPDAALQRQTGPEKRTNADTKQRKYGKFSCTLKTGRLELGYQPDESETDEEISIGKMSLEGFNKFSVDTRLKMSANAVCKYLERIGKPGSPPSVNAMNEFFNEREKTHKSGQFSDKETQEVLDFLGKYWVQGLQRYSPNDLDPLKKRCSNYLDSASGKKNKENSASGKKDKENAEKIRRKLNEIVDFPGQLRRVKEECMDEVKKIANKLREYIDPNLAKKFETLVSKKFEKPDYTVDEKEIQKLLQSMAKDLVHRKQKDATHQQKDSKQGYGL